MPEIKVIGWGDFDDRSILIAQTLEKPMTRTETPRFNASEKTDISFQGICTKTLQTVVRFSVTSQCFEAV